MEILYALEKIRVPVLDEAMLLITRLGEETVFLAAALIVFWCVDKKKGYYLLAVGFLGTMLNQLLKLVCQVPRPWILDPQFSIVEKAREAATGYSFPSGHTQSAVGTFGALAAMTEGTWRRTICICAAVLVPFSRMYLGVHTPMDVLVASLMAVGLVFALKPVMTLEDAGKMRGLLGVMLIMAAGLLVYVRCWPFPKDMDSANLRSGLKSAYTMLGCTVGAAVVFVCERNYVKFETRALWWVQILKTVAGLGVVLLVKEGLRDPLELVLDVYSARSVRYFLIVLTAGLLWPSTFRWFSKIGVKYELRNDQKL